MNRKLSILEVHLQLNLSFYSWTILAEFLGEALIFGVAGTLLLLDTARNSRKEEARRAAIESKFTELYDRIRQLESLTPDGPQVRQSNT